METTSVVILHAAGDTKSGARNWDYNLMAIAWQYHSEVDTTWIGILPKVVHARLGVGQLGLAW